MTEGQGKTGCRWDRNLGVGPVRAYAACLYRHIKSWTYAPPATAATAMHLLMATMLVRQSLSESKAAVCPCNQTGPQGSREWARAFLAAG